jgi:hypothetical protein
MSDPELACVPSQLKMGGNIEHESMFSRLFCGFGNFTHPVREDDD